MNRVRRPDKLVLPDLVLTELGASGTPPLVAHLRGSPLTEDVPVLLFASGGPDERRRALLLGISDLIQRPYDPEDVLLLVGPRADACADDCCPRPMSGPPRPTTSSIEQGAEE